jgi:hypothetical protein
VTTSYTIPTVKYQMKFISKKVAIYLPVNKGLLLSDIINICKDPLNSKVLTGLHPLKRAGGAGFGILMMNSEDSEDVFRMKICHPQTRQPWIGADWGDWNAGNNAIYSEPIVRVHTRPGLTKMKYRGMIYRGAIKCEMCYDMPKDIVEAMVEAFARAGFGKPLRIPTKYSEMHLVTPGIFE